MCIDYPRGSEWREWDLHIHTPASFFWKGQKFVGDMNSAANIALVDEMIDAMNKAKPAVFAIMDYWSFDGWFALKNRLAQPGAPELSKTVFPGIERVCSPKGRLNAHIIFSDKAPDQELLDFVSAMRIELIDKPLSPAALRECARDAGADKLKTHGYKKEDVDSDDEVALKAGYEIAELKVEPYKEALKRLPEGLAVGFMPWGTYEGLGGINPMDHYAYAPDPDVIAVEANRRRLTADFGLISLDWGYEE